MSNPACDIAINITGDSTAFPVIKTSVFQNPRRDIDFVSDFIGSYRRLASNKDYREYLRKTASLKTLFSEEYVLTKEILFDNVHRDITGFSIYSSELGVYGAGPSLRAAQEDCASLIISVYEELSEGDAPLSEDAAGLRDIYSSLIIKRTLSNYG